MESQFRLTNDVEIFTSEIHAIKEAITGALRRGLDELNIYSDSR